MPARELHAATASINQRWHRRFGQQYVALLSKNALVAVRNWRSTAIRIIIAPFLFIALIWLVNQALVNGNTGFDSSRSITDPTLHPVRPIPDCTKNLYLNAASCYEFVYAPNNNAVVNGIVDAIRTNNPGRPIPTSRVGGFPTRTALNAFELAHPQTVLGGLIFQFDTSGNLGFIVQTNSTVKNFHGVFQNPTTYVQVPLQVAAEREIARHYFSLAGKTFDAVDWVVSLLGFAHPPVSAYSLIGQISAPFVFAANMFGFVLAITAIVQERELKLRQAMRTMGMLDSAFWLSWASYEIVMGTVTALLLAGFGAMWQFDLFLRNSFGLIFLTFFLFQLSMSSLAFLISTFLRKAATGSNMGFGIFIVGWIMQTVVIFGFPFTPDYVKSIPIVTVIFALCPWALLSKAFQDLGTAATANEPGISWGNRNSYCMNLSYAQQLKAPYNPNEYVDYRCVLSIQTCMIILLVEALVYFAIAIFLDNVLPNESGVRRPPWYFLTPSYWGFRKVDASGTARLKPPVACAADSEELDPDVADEQTKLRELLAQRTSGDTVSVEAVVSPAAVELHSLQKVFGRSWTRFLNPRNWCGARRKAGSQDFWAMKGSTFSIEQGQLFCLLGPNGAGKTTTINCLTGVMPPSGGDALVYGSSICAAGGMDEIRANMGVCPQFDILWAELSGREHMMLYGAIKGIPSKDVRKQSEELLTQVQLQGVLKVRTGRYSGGMRRRLSVAIALLGDPKIVFLDEPTTGLDPISRRATWDIIEAAKPGRAIVLTTHSMEEADILGDRIAIMARGRLRALGSSLRLKQRFGSGYQIAVSTASSSSNPSTAELEDVAASPAMAGSSTAHIKRNNAVKAFFRAELGLETSEESRAYVQFLVPHTLESRLAGFLAKLEAASPELGICDIQMSLTSLEEVFLNIAKKAELDAAAAEGGGAITNIQLESGGILKVLPGQESAVDEANGVTYTLTWAQDDTGAISVLDWQAVEGEPVVA